MKTLKPYWLLIAALGLLIGLVSYQILVSDSEKFFGASTPTQTVRYNLLGTSSVPLTLTSAFTGGGAASSTGRLTKSMPHLAFSGTYTPNSYGSYMQIKVERSLDDGATFEPYSLIEPRASDVLVHTSGTTGMPFTIPGSGSAASGTALTFSFDLTLVADYVRVFAREVTTSTAGTLFTKMTAQSL